MQVIFSPSSVLTHKREIYEVCRTFGTLLTGQYIPAAGPALISVWDVDHIGGDTRGTQTRNIYIL
jgi:hypothetical protein